jgi:hypothetical protein
MPGQTTSDGQVYPSDAASPASPAKPSARELAHDLSNALEIIMQTSFLLGTLDLGENGQKWHKLLEAGIEKAAVITKQLRETLRSS